MPKQLNLISKRFNRLTVVSYDKSTIQGRKWLVQCDCGKQFTIQAKKITKRIECSACSYKNRGNKKRKDFIGIKIGRLTPIRIIENANRKTNNMIWECKCDCGKTTFVNSGDLSSNHTKSCGCLKKENKPNLRHNMTYTRFYMHWTLIKRRCTNKNSPDYSRYGGRGIKMCDRWQSFDSFKEDLFDSYTEHCKKYTPKNTTAERINNKLGYTPTNFRWATWEEQIENKVKRLRVTFKSEVITLKKLAEKTGYKYHLLWRRFNSGTLSKLLDVTTINKPL